MDNFRVKTAQCQTMGHEGCKHILVLEPGAGWKWIIEKTIHKVYGKTHIEYPKK